MIERFETGKWYRWTSPKKGTIWNSSMEEILDGKPRLCIKGTSEGANFEGMKTPSDRNCSQDVWHWYELENFEEVEMDIQKQIDGLKAEIERLQARVDEKKSTKIKYDSMKLYVAVGASIFSKSYILYGAGDGFEWSNLISTGGRWSTSIPSGEEAIDYMISKGFPIHTFDTKKEALTFMLEQE